MTLSACPQVSGVVKCGLMNARRVNILAGLTATLLAFFSLGFHEGAIDADEAQIRLACRSICKVSVTEQQGNAHRAPRWTDIVQAFKGGSCADMSDEDAALLRCVEALTRETISVRDYRCLKDTTSLSTLSKCDAL